MLEEIESLARMNLVSLFPTHYATIDEVPESVIDIPSNRWMEAKDMATMVIYDSLSRVCVVKSIDSDESIDTAKLHEPFRAAMDPQKHILYKWICLRFTCLDKGFCAHCFFVEHHNHGDDDSPTPIPESVDVRSLSAMSDNTRTFIRRGRPSSTYMSSRLES